MIGILFILLLFLERLARGSEEVKKVGLSACVPLAIIIIPVYLNGEGVEKVVKDLPGATEAFIGRHEENSRSFPCPDSGSWCRLRSTFAEPDVCGAGLLFFRRSATIPKWFIALVLVLSFGAAAVAGLAENPGGQIRHTEIREVVASPVVPDP